MSKFSHVPAWTFGGKTKPKIMTSTAPGPGKYSDGYYAEEERLRKGLTIPRAEKTEKESNDRGVGPGDYYRGYSSLTKNGISFKGGRFKIKKSDQYKQEIGPGKYKVSGNLNGEKKGVSFGKSKRKELTDYGETGDIGPGTYTNDYSNKNAVGNKFGRSNRKKLRDPETGDVGPGHYNDNRSQLSRKGGVMNRQKREFMGPGTAQETGDKLGPGYYSEDIDTAIVKNKKSGKGHKIPKGKRSSMKKKNKVPGPGQYYTGREMSHRNFVNGGSFGKSHKGTNSALGPGKLKVPGPGMYGNLGGKGKNKGGGYSFGRSKGRGNRGNGTPGPGQYSKQRPRRGMRGKRPWSVGTFGTSKRGFTSDQNAKRNEDTAHIGPGSYNYHKRPSSEVKKGWSMGTQERGYMKPSTNVPGPGTYNKNSKKSHKGGTFRKDDESKKHSKGPGGKIGNYMNGMIPDVAPYALPKAGNRKINPAY